jgi:hypothetical protein
MVSRYKRHLSLFLVMLLVMSWFVLPEADKPWIPVAKAATSTLEVAPDALKINGDYLFSYRNESSQSKTSVTFTWNRPSVQNAVNKSSVATNFEIQYLAASAAPKGMTVELCKSSLSPWQTLPNATGLLDPHLGSNTETLTIENARGVVNEDVYFRLTVNRAATVLNPPTPVACGKEPLVNIATTCASGNVTVRLTSTPSGATVTVGNQTLKQFANQDESTTPVTICVPRNDQTGLVNFSTFNFSLSGYKAATRQIDFTEDERVEALLVAETSKEKSTSTSVKAPGTGTDAGGTVTAGSAAAAAYFEKINSSSFKLSDDPTDKTDTNTDGVIDPLKAPIITMSKAKLDKMPADIVWRLTNLVRSSETSSWWHWGTNNNYFLFKMENLTKDQEKILSDNKIVPALTYLAIDVSGNMGVLVDDPTKEGGMFAAGKATLDQSSAQFVAMGQFDGNITDGKPISKNPAGEPLAVNLEQYSAVITKRVYNDAQAEGTSCVASPLIHYPDTNTSYDDTKRFPAKIPFGDYRKCINLDSEGWLAKWKIKDTKIDQAAKTECEEAFGNNKSWFSFITDTFAKSICFVLNVMVGGATWMAGFSVDFMIKAIGLQLR